MRSQRAHSSWWLVGLGILFALVCEAALSLQGDI